jgi:hypothetical protein
MASLGLVVATRLHTQISSFRLYISSNEPSCSEESHEWNNFANPISEKPSGQYLGLIVKSH